MVPDHSTDAAVIKLAAHISASQAPEIATLKGLILSWSAEADSDAPGHAKAATTGMVDQATMTKVASLQGADFDRLWLHAMTGHHRGAVEMAQAEIDNGRNADAVAIAHNIVKTQQAEIDQMTKMLEGR